MTKVYQPDSENWIPHTVYMRIVYFVKDYANMCEREKNIIEESPQPSDGTPRGTEIGDPTARMAIRLDKLHDDIKAYERALECVPEEYRGGIIDNICYHTAFPEYANIKTWKKWKGRFIRKIAENLSLL